jgi:hypothetical protein
MRKNFWNKRIPTLLGILLITIGVAVTIFLVNQSTLFKSNASTTEQPQNVRITNVTDNSFSISYETEIQVIGSLNYGKNNKLGQQALDDRDQQTGSLGSHMVHNITVRNLDPQMKYYFSITSGQNNYTNGDQLFEVSTGPKLSDSPPKQNPMSGKITLIDGTNPKEAIVYITADNSQVISTLVKADGSYILPLNSLRASDLSSYYTFPDNASVKMLILGDSLTSNVSLSINQISPLPTVILSKDYDFREGQSSTGVIPQTVASFPSFSSTSSASQILMLKKGQEFTDQKPVFKGTAAPGESVEIIIHSSQAIKTSVTTDSNGNWNYRPTSNLTPGNHTITIQAKDSSGILQTITQSFVVYAAGQQVLPAVISGTPTPTPTAKITPTKTVSPTLALTPTAKVTPTKTVSPTLALTPTVIILPTANPSPASIQTTNSSPTLTPIPTQTLTTKGGILISPVIKKPLPPTGNPSIITAGIIGAAIAGVGSLLLILAL